MSVIYAKKFPHLVDENRIELAINYLIHEMEKIFCYSKMQLKSEFLLNLRKNLQSSLSEMIPNKESDNYKIRDFWNLFTSFSSCWKLKNLTNIVTNPNFIWRCQEINIKQLIPESDVADWTKEVKKKNYNLFSFNLAIDYLRSKKEILSIALINSDKIAKKRTKENNSDPLIGHYLDNNKLIKICDGNRRLTHQIEKIANNSVLDDCVFKMNVWVGEKINYNHCDIWINTGCLIEVKSIHKKQLNHSNGILDICDILKQKIRISI